MQLYVSAHAVQYTDYLEIHLKSVSTITAIKTQGRYGTDQYHIEYQLSFVEESSTIWLVYKDDYGNDKVSTLSVFIPMSIPKFINGLLVTTITDFQ